MPLTIHVYVQDLFLLQSAGLMIFHTHSRMLAGGDEDAETSLILAGGTAPFVDPDLPMWQFYLQK